MSKNGVLLATDCVHGSARPFGANSEYPPLGGDGVPTGWNVTADLGAEGVIEVAVTTRFVFEDNSLYLRVLSDVSGGIKGKTQRWSGTALNEQFTLVPK